MAVIEYISFPFIIHTSTIIVNGRTEPREKKCKKMLQEGTATNPSLFNENLVKSS